MKDRVKISIIMGTYNPTDKDRLFRAVRSLIFQSFPDWELILYDDGSNKDCEKNILEAADLDDRILHIRNDRNQGLAHALNVCIQHSAGTYIARMDDDDISQPERLERQYRFLDAHPEYQWVGSSAELMDRDGVWGLQKMPEIPLANDFLYNSPYIHPSVMFRREILTESGGYSEAKKYLHCEDYELFMRLHKNGGRGYNIQEPLLQYWEDYESYKKRTYARRIREMKLRRKGFRELNILNGTTLYYVWKPLLIGAVPAPVHHYINRRLKRRKKSAVKAE